MDNIITIRNGDFTATINLEALDQLTLYQWKKLIREAEYEFRDNVQAMETAVEFITGMIQAAENDWRETSRDFINNYRDPAFIHGKTKAEKKKLMAKNKTLMAKVKTAKHQKTIWEKRLAAIHKHFENVLRTQK